MRQVAVFRVPRTAAELIAQAHRVATDQCAFAALRNQLSEAPSDVASLVAPVASCIEQLNSKHWPEFDLLRALVQKLLQAASQALHAKLDQQAGLQQCVIAITLLCHVVRASNVRDQA